MISMRDIASISPLRLRLRPLRVRLSRCTLLTTTIAAVACTTEAPTRPMADVQAVGLEAQSARQPAPPPSGTLSICKQGGAGIPAGQTFTFQVTLADVVRTVPVAAGGCVPLEVPRESAPSSKGYFQNKPAAVTRLLPGTTTLHVDAADLSSARVQAILGAAPNVVASSSLLLNLAQQLIAADLNVLRGAQPTAQVVQAMADANAALQIALGAQITLTTALDPAALSALVNTLSAFNEGKTSAPATPLAIDVDVVELLGSFVELTGISCAPADSCSGVDLAAASVTAAIESGATTAVTFTNRSKPVLRVCKVAGPGIEAGRVFRFSAAGNSIPDGAVFDVPAGECRDAILTEGVYTLLESGTLTGLAVSSITCEPAAHCANVSLQVGYAQVTVARGITTVTVTNRSTLGVVRFCKVAGSGIAAGRAFTLSASGFAGDFKPGEPTSASVQVPAGECREATLLEGTYDAGEPNVPAGVAVSAMACVPADRCTNVSLGLGILKAQVVGASTTTITVTNRSTLGTLRFCKVAGTGIEAGRVFTMVASFAEQTGEPSSGQASVPAGECRDITLHEGWYGATETGPATVGTAVSSIVCAPAARCSSTSLGARFARTQIIGASTTTVTFTNRSTLATLRVCKVGGIGVIPGTSFRFFASGISLTAPASEPTTADIVVPAGECRSATVFEGLYDVTEPTPGVGVHVSAISCMPVERCPDINVSVGDVKAMMVGGSTTEVTFTNSASAAVSMQSRMTVPSSADRTAIQRP